MKKHIFLLVIVALVAACAPPAATPTQPVATAIPTITQMEIPQPIEQPTPTPTKTQLEFLVHIPDNTPAADTIYLVLLPFWDGDELERIRMTARGDGTWWASTELEEGSLIRYSYDRGPYDWSAQIGKKEQFSGDIQILYRYLFVSPATSSVEDTVALWNDIPATPLTGTVSGIITDKTTGKPLMDATVSIGGVHIATNYDGSFTLRDVPAGNQRVTALTTLGDYKYASKVIHVSRDETSTVAFDLEPARKVKVTFSVETPSDTPPDAVARLAGNAFQMGLYPGPFPNYGFTRWSPSRQVFMNRLTQNSFTASVELFEGSYIQYVYTLVNSSFGDEKSFTGEPMLRSFIVGAAEETRNERIAAWKAPGQVAITFKVSVPINTPPTSMVFMDIGGPYVAMDMVSKNQWALTFFTYPDNTFQYKYLIGRMGLERFEPDDPATYRTTTIPGQDKIINDVVERWKWYPKAVEPALGTPISVTFKVTIPFITPAGDTIYLVGDSPELGSDVDPKAVPMTQVPSNPWLWEAKVAFDSAKRVTYRYTRGVLTNAENEPRTLDIAYDGQTMNDAVFSWVDIPFSLSRGFIATIYPDDLWDPEYLPLFEPTLSRIKSINAQYVGVSSVWNYGQAEPLPEMEPRPMKTGSVFTPTEDLVVTINMTHSKGLKAFILPQFNMEMTPGGEKVLEAQSNEWWDKWFEEAEKLYLYNADIAERTGAEMLLLPGSVFMVFPGPNGFKDPSYISVFDQKMKDLIGKVRQHYGGHLVVSGAQYALYDFPGLADYVVITAFDWGKLNVPSNASVQDIKRALENALDRYAKPMFAKYNKPVIVELTYDSVDNAANGVRGDAPWNTDDPMTVLDVIEQANIYEAFFQAIIDRPWVGGTFDYSYHYYDLPEDETASIRAKPAEAVLSKYYRAFEQP